MVQGGVEWEEEKKTVELRFYEIPQGEPVLALLGE